MARTPHGYHDRGALARDLQRAGFSTAALIRTETRLARSRLRARQRIVHLGRVGRAHHAGDFLAVF